MTGPIAYHLNWTTYGTWLPGDERGWTDGATGTAREPDELARDLAYRAMSGQPVALTLDQRATVEATVRRHCEIRRWHLHALHIGAVHIHAVVTADRPADVAIAELKAWCSRTLNHSFGRRAKWWTEGGYNRWIEDERTLTEVIKYVVERQTQASGYG